MSRWKIRCANVSGVLFIGTNEGRTSNEVSNKKLVRQWNHKSIEKKLHFQRRCQLEHKNNYAGNWAVRCIFIVCACERDWISAAQYWIMMLLLLLLRQCATLFKIHVKRFPFSNISWAFWFSSDCFGSAHTHIYSSHVYFMINSIFRVSSVGHTILQLTARVGCHAYTCT